MRASKTPSPEILRATMQAIALQLENAFVRQGQIFDAIALPNPGGASYQRSIELNPDYS
ncbi:hypothetical protein [Nostoc sp.]|uniref:hypothetical protein n=1 Tax=Nostoc sp. TaxID=1180 RepID=UPI002FF76112